MIITLIAPITIGPLAMDMPTMQWTAYFYNISGDGWARCGPYVIDHAATEKDARRLAVEWTERNPNRSTGGYSTVHVCRYWEFVVIANPL